MTFFAIACISELVGRINSGKPYPIEEVTLALHIYQLYLMSERVGVGDIGSHQDMQEFILAIRCRFTLTTDSIRACIKGLFTEKLTTEVSDEIDQRVDHAVSEAEEYYTISANGLAQFQVDALEIGNPETSKILEQIKGVTTQNIKQRFYIADFLDQVAEDIEFILWSERIVKI